MQRANADGTCFSEWECSHWMQSTSTELPANLRDRVQCRLGLKQDSTKKSLSLSMLNAFRDLSELCGLPKRSLYMLIPIVWESVKIVGLSYKLSPHSKKACSKVSKKKRRES